MKKQLKTRFIKNLLSGKFEQQRTGCLKNVKGYCCLGVLRYTMNPRDKYSSHAMGQTLAPCQLKKAGVTEDQQDDMVWMNDIDMKSFKEIAGWAKENL